MGVTPYNSNKAIGGTKVYAHYDLFLLYAAGGYVNGYFAHINKYYWLGGAKLMAARLNSSSVFVIVVPPSGRGKTGWLNQI
jgi:hypothetical protein